MALKVIDLEVLNKEIPCDKRKGYADSCKCRNEDGIERRLVTCNHFRRGVREAQCRNCYYQKKYIVKLHEEKEGKE